MEIPGKTILVTGAAKRVGRVIALHLAEKGAHIVLHYHRSKDDALKTQKEIEKFGVRCFPLSADLSDEASVKKAVSALDKEKTKVDVLINSASIFYKQAIFESTGKDWENLIGANLKGPFFLSQALGKRMFEKQSGKIINIVDWSGLRPYKDYAIYCTSKGGLITLTKALARDLAPHVLVNAIAPGPVLEPENFSEEEKQAVVQKTVVGRWGKPEDIAYAASFLIENDFMNGAVLVVDGGRSIV